MDIETKKTLKFDELSDQFDRINEKDQDSEDMFDFNIIVPFSDSRTPKPTRWRKGGLAVTKNRPLK